MKIEIEATAQEITEVLRNAFGGGIVIQELPKDAEVEKAGSSSSTLGGQSPEMVEYLTSLTNFTKGEPPKDD